MYNVCNTGCSASGLFGSLFNTNYQQVCRCCNGNIVAQTSTASNGNYCCPCCCCHNASNGASSQNGSNGNGFSCYTVCGNTYNAYTANTPSTVSSGYGCGCGCNRSSGRSWRSCGCN